MAGNSERRGAKRNPGTKKGPVVGSGGQRRRQLEGKGPTPKAVERPGHKASRRAVAAERHTARTSSGPRSGRSGGGKDSPEVVAGRNSVVEALRVGVPAKTLWVAERAETDDRIRESIKLAAKLGVPILEIPRVEMDRIAGGAVHQGVALQVPAFVYAHPDDLVDAAFKSDTPALIVALDSVTDPRNLGAVVRSAAAFGAHGVLVPERRAAGMTASAWKTSAGAAARLPIARTANLARQLREYRKAGLFIVGLDAGGSVDVAEIPVADRPMVLVVGSEDAGLSRIVTEACDVVASIAMVNDVESLNAGVAAGVALYAVSLSRLNPS